MVGKLRSLQPPSLSISSELAAMRHTQHVKSALALFYNKIASKGVWASERSPLLPPRSPSPCIRILPLSYSPALTPSSCPVFRFHISALSRFCWLARSNPGLGPNPFPNPFLFGNPSNSRCLLSSLLGWLELAMGSPTTKQVALTCVCLCVCVCVRWDPAS